MENIMQKIFLAVILVFGFSAASVAQEQLTLEQSIRIALQKNTNLLKNVNSLETEKANVRQQWGGLLPSISAGGSWNWQRTEDKGVERYIEGIGTVSNDAEVENRTYSASVNSQWTLFDGLANYASISQSSNNLDAAKLELQRLKQDIVFQTVSQYFKVLNAKKLVGVYTEDLKWNQKNLETVTERHNLGAVTLADVYAQQVEVGTAEVNLINAENNFALLTSNFLDYLGLNVLDSVDLSDPSAESDAQILEGEALLKDFQGLSDLVNEALQTRYDYESSKLRLESAGSGVTIARSGFLPSLSNTASFGTSANKLGGLGDSKSYTVGLNLNLSLFNGWSTSYQVQSAKVTEKNQEIAVSEKEREIKIDLKNTYLEFIAAKKRLDVSQKKVQAAEENRKIEQEKYNLGAGTLLDLLQVNSRYTLALQENIQYKFEFLTLRSQLEYQLGRLDYKKYE
jgi:outer membrane protein